MKRLLRYWRTPLLAAIVAALALLAINLQETSDKVCSAQERERIVLRAFLREGEANFMRQAKTEVERALLRKQVAYLSGLVEQPLDC